MTGKTLKFESGKISKFTVNGFTKKESDEVYTLVTDASTLKIGDKIIIAAATADFAISTTQNKSNRGQAAVTKKNKTIVNPGNDVQVFTLEAGTKSDTYATYAFNTGSGYIYAASSSANQLKTQQTNNDNGSWTIYCTAEGVATIKAQGKNTRNLLKYNNDTNTGKVFSCYSSGQSDVAIYSDGKGTGSVPTPPVIKAESTSVSLNHDDETDHYMTVTITGAEADGINCKVAENADGTGEAPAWLTANYPDKDGKLSYMAEANTTDAARTAYIILSASNADGATSLAIKVTQNGVGGAGPKTYTLTISTTDFSTDSYANNNKERTTKAFATDGSTIDVTWKSNQIMQRNNVMQWQKSNGSLHNITDLGKIINIQITSKEGTFSQIIGTSQEPTKNVDDGGYFKISVGAKMGTTEKVVITFEK